MPDHERRTLIDRADRIMKQSKDLRKMSTDMMKHSGNLHRESVDIRKTVKKSKSRKRR